MFWKKQRIVNPHFTEVQYTTGPLLGGEWRARNAVFQKMTEYPVTVLKAKGQIAGQFGKTQDAQLRVLLAVPEDSLTGAGKPSAQHGVQPLIDPSGVDLSQYIDDEG